MDENTRDELLSAYLDGELEAADAARIEQLLSEDEQAQATLDEMQAVRRALRALPRHQLDVDFSSGVIRSAERVVLLGESLGVSGSAEPASGLERHWRRIVWPLVAVAAALLIAVNPGGFLTTSHDEAPLALREDEKPNRVTPPSEADDLAVHPTDERELEKLHLQSRVGKDDNAADKADALADEQGADGLVADGANAAAAAPSNLDDTIYVICEVARDKSPREVARQFEGRYHRKAKANKFQQSAGFRYADAVEFELDAVRVIPGQPGTTAPTNDAKPEVLGQKNDSPSDQPAERPSSAIAARRSVNDAGAEAIEKRQVEIEGEVRLAVTMTDDQFQTVIGQLRTQPGWTVSLSNEADRETVHETLHETGEVLAEESTQEKRGRLSRFDRLAIQEKQDQKAFGASVRTSPQFKADSIRKPLSDPAAPVPSAIASQAGKTAGVADAPKEPRDASATARVLRFKSAELAKVETKQPGAKDKKSADDQAFTKKRTDAKSEAGILGGQRANKGSNVTDVTQPAPSRHVVFIFRAAAEPQVEAAEQAK
jgi:hypothetical protein